MNLLAIVFLYSNSILAYNSSKTNSIPIANLYQDTTRSFNSWLNDTIIIYRQTLKKEKEKSLGLIKSNLKVCPDSSCLKVNISYFYIINPQKIPSGLHSGLKNVVDLLNQYEEIPKSNFTISFEESYYYYPSQIPHLSYEVNMRIENLKIIIAKERKKIYYTIIRGRLNDKCELIKHGNRKKIKRYNFIWADNQLQKVLL